MRLEVAQKLVSALRSGEYKQAFGTMFYDDPDGSRGYCCLGVLSDLYCKDSGRSITDLYKNPADRMVSTVHKDVAEWAGISTQVMRFGSVATTVGRKVLAGERYLHEYNDDDKLSFNAISDIVQKYFVFPQLVSEVQQQPVEVPA